MATPNNNITAKTLTVTDVAKHSKKNDLYMIIHGKVYDCSTFVDEHPGGEEVLLDLAGQDATTSFEDVGHSDDARETLEKLYVADLNDPAAAAAASKYSLDRSKVNSTKPSSSNSSSMTSSLTMYAIVLVGAIIAYYFYHHR